MSTKFWKWYIYFFIFIFPLFFSFVGEFKWSALGSTASLVVGIILWVAFLLFILKRGKENNKLYLEAVDVQKNGKLTTATVLDFDVLKESNDEKTINLNLEFTNFAGTKVDASLPINDTKPHERRFELGNSVNIRLNNKRKNISVPFMFDTGTVEKKKTGEMGLFYFSIVYAVLVFIVNHMIWSDGDGWRWVTFIHPWVWIPLAAIFIFRLFDKVSGLGSQVDDATENELLLHGVRTEGEIITATQTGMYINEQPQMRIRIRFKDQFGKQHTVEKKQIVLLNEMHLYKSGSKTVLYLPDNPEIMMMLDETPAPKVFANETALINPNDYSKEELAEMLNKIVSQKKNNQ